MPKIKRPGALFVVFLVLIAIGLTGLFIASDDYISYTSSTLEGSASVAPLNKESLQKRLTPAAQPYNTEVKYRTFFITAPNAKKVELWADFNRWGQDPIVLKAYRKGYFETSVALTSGEYKYLFSVDGKPVLDPSNTDRITLEDGREVCIKTVR